MAPCCACFRCCDRCLDVCNDVYDICFGIPVLRHIASLLWDSRSPEDEHRTTAKKWTVKVAKLILQFLISALSLYLVGLVFFRPYKVRPYVDAAVLAAFGFTSDAAGHGRALQYDLALNVTFFNDNHICGVRFDHLTARLYYNGTELGPADDTLPMSFNLGTRRHRTVSPTLRGRARAADIGATVVEELSRQQAQGRLSLDVMVKTTMTYMFWPAHVRYYYEYDCWLQFPAPGNSSEPEVVYSRAVDGQARGARPNRAFKNDGPQILTAQVLNHRNLNSKDQESVPACSASGD